MYPTWEFVSKLRCCLRTSGLAFVTAQTEFNKVQKRELIDLYFGNGINVQSPNEFLLIQLKLVKNSREIIVGKHSNLTHDSGVDDKAKMPFGFKKIMKGIYEVTFEKPLPKGEYGFMIARPASRLSDYDNVIQKIYDFSVM